MTTNSNVKTDRELLDLAAKACGVGPVIGFAAEACELMICPSNHMRYWRPLTNDGDAMRLAVKLKICMEFYNGFAEIHASHCSGDYDSSIEYYSDDMAASSRRTIVRAAAAIGESMP